MTPASFRAFRANTSGDTVDRGVVALTAADLPDDGALIGVHY
jgi:hypothetical protein